ncbi:related to H. sapiens F-box protein [Cephalotrichum gorgonifer]|uniref:Related to H. sapiens F-box protein n=1 Tax=Cephalotrichum gorgonifer TaxID=2041049 RepID=A0AAE8MYK5_9PEZI|nr:related to H. sapiens F-box protein [Cephalotrichum gorgonifer]
MTPPPEEPRPELKSELEAFREQWISEVKSKQPASGPGPSHSRTPSSSVVTTAAAGPASADGKTTKSRPNTHHVRPKLPTLQSGDDHMQPPAFDEILSLAAAKNREAAKEEAGEMVTALDYFEAAVVREAQGELGDSLNLYRKAFRMDSQVDQAYRKKHFPATAPKLPSPEPPTSSSTAPNPKAAAPPQSMTDLISSFQNLTVVPLPPAVEGDPPPPCPIASLPEETLFQIFLEVAVLDVADFSRLSHVCKRFAYLVATEQRIWRRVCLGPEFGFGGMHYRFQRSITWDPLPDEPSAVVLGDGSAAARPSDEERTAREDEEKAAVTLALHPALYSSSWRQMFRHRPRIRFSGCYIATANYIRAGSHTNGSHITWNSPVHIVTYYRYLRFFRDGTVASLLSSAEPADVVPHFTREALEAQREGQGAAHLPSAVVRGSLRGRWRLIPAGEPEAGEEGRDAGGMERREGDLVVETEGVHSKYIYRMDLSLRSAGKAARNNKLLWRGFYSYNKLTDDWAEFLLKNDKPFYFSRVRSYGVMG